MATTGLRTCSYEAIKKKKFVVEGLPDEIEFHHPSYFGKKSLQKILANADKIRIISKKRFLIVSVNVDDNCEL